MNANRNLDQHQPAPGQAGTAALSRRRRERRAGRRLLRCLLGERGAVFLEFAMGFPVVLAFALFLIEVCHFWDTTVMANHAAFALARIAKVHRYQGGGKDGVMYPKMAIKGRQYPADQVVAAMFMMGPTYTWYDASAKGGIDIDFVDYFKIGDKLWEITVPDDADFFKKLIVKILNGLLGPLEQKIHDFIDQEIDQGVRKLLGDFDKPANAKFKMAFQRTSMAGTLATTLEPLGQSLAFPSEDYYTPWQEPEVVKVAVSYPLHRGGWLYSGFLWMGDPAKPRDALRASGRHAMLVEPEKEDLGDYFANDDGSYAGDVEDMKRRARQRAKDIVDKALVPLLDQWEQAIVAREQADQAHGKKSDEYKNAVKKESQIWGQIKDNIGKFAHIIESTPKHGGLCGDQDDGAGFFCTSDPTSFTKCARIEYNNARYCDKVAQRIRDIAGRHGLWSGWDGLIRKPFPHYVDKVFDAYPGHSHGWCSNQYFCGSP